MCSVQSHAEARSVSPHCFYSRDWCATQREFSETGLPAASTVHSTPYCFITQGVGRWVCAAVVCVCCEFNTLWVIHVSLASWGADDLRWAGVNSSELLSHDALNGMMGGGSEMENTHVVARIISYIPLAQLWVELAAGGNELPGKWGQK